ncbi:hypothetical protein [Devosia nitrariae]|uniref:HNH endonuclease n=1 Tax=Devosia nitrariae TaxID=2071872 RepID=A0ABQ5W406_9HYPH|nr:hypothetical protein [Devosia nitrariae]GLQ54660.1 hypothetical protein GCM10010862_19190 [Devosia nitrariae]
MLAAIIDRRRLALIQSWVANPLVQVQVESPMVLPRLVFINDETGQSGSVGQVGRRAMTNTAIVEGGPDKDRSWSVWVASGYSSYQKAYLAFIHTAYGIDRGPADLAGYDIDHLLNRARSPLGSSFIRIEAVSSLANRAWGGLFEKAASNRAFHANRVRERRTMSWMICAKLAGQMPPAGSGDTAGINRLIAFFRTLGLSDTEARDGISSMLDFAYRLR